MKILMLTPYLPFPPSSGGQIRSFNLIKYLSKKHDITLFSLIKDEKERKNVSELEKYCKKVRVFRRSKNPWTARNILKTGFGAYPFLVIRNLVTQEKDAVAKELLREDYDLIHAETFYVMPHIPETNIPVLLVDQTIEYLVYKHFVDVQAPFFARPLLSIDVAKLKYWEKEYWKKADKVVAVSRDDKKVMRNLVPKLDVEIVPNGVNLDFFKTKNSWKSMSPKILFVANFKWLQNIEAAEILVNKIFPMISSQHDKAKLWIVGQHIPESLKSKSSDKVIIDSLDEDDEESIKNAYHEASVFVSPLKGPGGTRLKHFAAMASNLPLITTKVGAEGLGAKNGEHVIVRNSINGLAQATVELLKNPKKAEKLAKNARILVVTKYSWTIMAKKLHKIYEKTGK